MAALVLFVVAVVVLSVAGLAYGIVSDRPSVAAHTATTANLKAIYPFQAPIGLGGRGVYVGSELLGGSFVFDQYQLYTEKVLTNPNILVLGQLGKGKSALIKTLIYRHAAFGRKSVVMDPKGEFGPLCEALGGTMIRLEPGGTTCLNPLDPGPHAEHLDPADIARRQDEVLGSLTEAALGRPLNPPERTGLQLALTQAVRGHQVATIVDVMELLLSPVESMAAEIESTVSEMREDLRHVGLTLRRMIKGDMKGMFDGPTNIEVDWDSPIVVIDLSGLGASDHGIRVVMAATLAWLQSILINPYTRVQRLLVLDEAWRLLANLAIARWLQSSFKLSRQHGISNVMVVHRISDFDAAGAGGGETRAVVSGLLTDTETRIIYSQPVDEIPRTTAELSLTSTEAELLPTLAPGVALWKVGRHSFLVKHRICPAEWPIIDTDARMHTQNRAPGEAEPTEQVR